MFSFYLAKKISSLGPARLACLTFFFFFFDIFFLTSTFNIGFYFYFFVVVFIIQYFIGFEKGSISYFNLFFLGLYQSLINFLIFD